MSAIYKKELRSFFTGMIGCIVIAFLLFMTGIFSVNLNFIQRYPTFEYNFNSLGLVLLFVIPILTMRSIAEERSLRTDIQLYSLPLTMTQTVLGKYFAMLTVLAIPTGVMCLYPLIMACYGSVGLVATYSAIFGFFLLAATLTAIGLFMSSLTESQVIAAVLAFAALLVCYIMEGVAALIPATALASFIAFVILALAIALIIYTMTKSYWISFGFAAAAEIALVIIYLVKPFLFAGLFPNILRWLSLFSRIDTFCYSGIFDITSIIYYASVACVFVFFTIQNMDKRRWC